MCLSGIRIIHILVLPNITICNTTQILVLADILKKVEIKYKLCKLRIYSFYFVNSLVCLSRFQHYGSSSHKDIKSYLSIIICQIIPYLK